jgi:hypothetical protein
MQGVDSGPKSKPVQMDAVDKKIKHVHEDMLFSKASEDECR